MTAKDVIASCLVIALGTILALHFALFWLYGGVFIHESNRAILTIETVMSVAIFIFGIERLISSANSRRQKRTSEISNFKTKAPYLTEHVVSPPFPRGIEQARVFTTTAATIIPATAALHVETDARYMNECNNQLSKQTDDHGDIFFRFINGEDETTVYSEKLQV